MFQPLTDLLQPTVSFTQPVQDGLCGGAALTNGIEIVLPFGFELPFLSFQLTNTLSLGRARAKLTTVPSETDPPRSPQRRRRGTWKNPGCKRKPFCELSP